MKMIKLFLVAIVVIFASTAQADGEYIGSAFRVTAEGGCFWLTDDSTYEGDYWIQFSNGKKGHETFKCKMDLTDGEGVIHYSEGDTGGYPLNVLGHPDAMCYQTLVADVDTAMWTVQCFSAWRPRD